MFKVEAHDSQSKGIMILVLPLLKLNTEATCVTSLMITNDVITDGFTFKVTNVTPNTDPRPLCCDQLGPIWFPKYKKSISLQNNEFTIQHSQAKT